MSKQMPCLFLAHGTPMNALENNRWARDWKSLAEDIPTPDAIVMISAHWCSRELEICSNPQPPTIHDFRGFPPTLFAQQHPCPGSPEIAKEISLLLEGYDVKLNNEYGLDHGAWSLLKHLDPGAEIPCLQISLDLTRSLAEHYEIAAAMKPLRQQNILFIGSGNIVHNLPRWMNNSSSDISWAYDFDQAVKKAIDDHNHQAILDYPSLSQEALEAVPHPDHFLPLVYILGLSERDDPIHYSQNLDPSQLEDCCMRSVRFG